MKTNIFKHVLETHNKENEKEIHERNSNRASEMNDLLNGKKKN